MPGEVRDKLQKLPPSCDLSLMFAPTCNLALVYLFVKLCQQVETVKGSPQAVRFHAQSSRCVSDACDWYLQEDRPVMWW